MKFLKNHLVLGLLLILMGGIIVLGFNYYNNQRYAKNLISAIDNNNVSQVEILMKSPFGNVDSLPIISKLFAKISEQEFSTPLQEACRKGNYEIIKLLIDKGANVNYIVKGMNEYSPLMLASCSEGERKIEIVKLLVDNGADIEYSYSGESAMTRLAEKDRDDSILLIEYLESMGGDINKRIGDDTLLHFACKSGSSIVIRYLVIDRKFDINAKGFNGETPLIAFNYSVTYNSFDDLLFLLENGADKALINNDGKTAYDFALENGDTEFAEILKP